MNTLRIFAWISKFRRFHKTKQTQNEVRRFFYNLAEFVFEYFCNSQRILVTFAKFCLNSLFATWSYRCPNPKHACAPFHLPQSFFDTTKTLQTPPPFAVFSCAYEVAQSPHENNMSGANTGSVLARFYDKQLGEGEGFCKNLLRQKTCVGYGVSSCKELTSLSDHLCLILPTIYISFRSTFNIRSNKSCQVVPESIHYCYNFEYVILILRMK